MLALGCITNAQTTEATSDQTANQSTSKIESLQKKDEQMKSIDDEITNNKLRAELGSNSKWSLRSVVNYQGGTIQRAFNEERPEIRAEGEEDGVVGLSADVAIKYRTSERTSLNFGTGINVDRLFHRTFSESVNADLDSNKRDEKGNVRRNANISDPYAEFNYAYKLGGLQNYTAVSAGLYTDSFITDVIGREYSAALQHSLIHNVGNNGFGMAFAYVGYIYKDESNFDSRGSRRMESVAYASPFYEYAINDKYNFRTVFNWFSFNKRFGDDFRQAVIQQSMGLGISVTRDIFLYPNIQFLPQNRRAELTNVALSANINVF